MGFLKGLLKRSELVTTGLLILVIIVAGVGYYFYNQYRNTQSILKNPNLVVEKQTKELVTKVGMLMDLPTDETPTIATVTDISKLKGQPFFAKAKNGDKVLIYPNAKKAILYDPTTNKIVDVAPVNIGQTTTGQQQSTGPAVQGATEAPKPTIAVTSAPSVAPTTK